MRCHWSRFEYTLSGKWLELLRQIAPGVTRMAVLQDPTITDGIGQFVVIQSVAPSLGVELSPVNVRDAGEIERAVAAFASAANSGLIVTPSGGRAAGYRIGGDQSAGGLPSPDDQRQVRSRTPNQLLALSQRGALRSRLARLG